MQRYVRRDAEEELAQSLRSFPVTALLGPRQCGKSTLARRLVADRADTLFLDLERPSDLRKLDDPEFFFHTQREKLICLDEVQRGPELFPLLRVMVDADRRPGRFLLLGSASQELIRQSSETLAGRIHYVELTPLTYSELIADDAQHYQEPLGPWNRGGFPDSVLARSDQASLTWRMDFIRTFLERDIPQFGFKVPARTMRRFWTMLAHYHGQTLNASKLGQALDVSHPTIRSYLDILEQTYMVRALPPVMVNTKKRLVKSPKVYLRDSGILHALLEIAELDGLLGHPVVGASWEGFCIEQITARMRGWRAGFYRTSSGEEMDLVLERGRKRLVFEFKASMSPRVSRGFPGTLEVLRPDRAWIIGLVNEPYPLRIGAVVANLRTVLEDLSDLD
ncbi:MAG: ATP-binding protein [Desulfurivibrionaceae bacterium]|nr:ATP-binding protein [Desulfobulbales bacterium]MDT8334180.1 ATP-binding protein [Desulfurivibrionaceae bacterium]